VTEFSYKPGGLWMRLAISAGFTAAGLGLWALSGWGFSGFDAVLGALVTLYFGAKLVFNLAEILFPRPVIFITQEGIRDRRLGQRLIPWTAIRRIKEVTGQIGECTLFLEVREPLRYVSPWNGIMWTVYAFNRWFGSKPEQTKFVPLTPPTVLELGGTTLLDAAQASAPSAIPID